MPLHTVGTLKDLWPKNYSSNKEGLECLIPLWQRFFPWLSAFLQFITKDILKSVSIYGAKLLNEFRRKKCTR